jgi:hypothetical protein
MISMDVKRYDGDRRIRNLSCWEQFLAMIFAQLTRREGLRDIEVSRPPIGGNSTTPGFDRP